MNKQHTFIKIISLLVIICLITASCKKYINEAPITSTYGSEFWTSQTSVEQAALAMYGQFRASLRGNDYDGTSSYFINGDLTAGTFLPAASQWNYQTIRADQSPAFNFSYVPYLEPQLQNWSRFYQVIAQCNLILQNVPVMSSSLFDNDATKNAYLGEALFMRAYTYFYITRIWGDPVYITKTFNDVDYGKIPPLARTPETTVLDSCIADLKIAANYLSFANGDPAKSLRANKGTVYALMAHIYAWQHDYANAHLACAQVISNGGYSLEPMATYTNIWKGKISAENIFQLPMQYDPNDPNFTNITSNWAEAQFHFFATFLKDSYVDDQKSDCWVSPSGGFVDQFFDTANDARYKAILKPTPATGGDVDGYLMMKYTNFQYQKPDTKTLPYFDNNLVLIRLSDIILLDAEARAYTGDLAGASEDLAQTESRAGITSYQNPTTQYDMIDEVVMERGREFIGEGIWYYDLIRTEPTQQWLDYIGYPSDRVSPQNKGYYWPLDMSTLFPQDNLLTQNPWWATHK